MLHFPIFMNIFYVQFWITPDVVQFPTSQNPEIIYQTFSTPWALWGFQTMIFINKYDQS